jgi:phosphotransferase system  glucose/maltose/N-acetylglucosamine-specific IIC component
MVLTFIVIISAVLSLLFALLVGMTTGDTFKQAFKRMFLGKDENYVMFNIFMCMCLFLVMFVTCAATYNTYIDKTNPNYYKNKK